MAYRTGSWGQLSRIANLPRRRDLGTLWLTLLSCATLLGTINSDYLLLLGRGNQSPSLCIWGHGRTIHHCVCRTMVVAFAHCSPKAAWSHKHVKFRLRGLSANVVHKLETPLFTPHQLIMRISHCEGINRAKTTRSWTQKLKVGSNKKSQDIPCKIFFKVQTWVKNSDSRKTVTSKNTTCWTLRSEAASKMDMSKATCQFFSYVCFVSAYRCSTPLLGSRFWFVARYHKVYVFMKAKFSLKNFWYNGGYFLFCFLAVFS